MNHKLFGIATGFFLIGTIFFTLERIWGTRRTVFRPGWSTDVAYWFFAPLASKGLARLVFPLFLLFGFMVAGARPDTGLLRTLVHGHGPLSRQPSWLQFVEVMLIGDFVGYWTHRLFHSRLLWRFHAVHHSPPELDWLAAARSHPIDEVLAQLMHAPIFLLLGFSLTTVAAATPLVTMYALLQHTNVPWSFGPLRGWIASPTFHRWHHSSEPDAIDKNFAGLLPLWDRLFGTYYMPDNRLPQKFGVTDFMPSGMFAQLLYPFQRVNRRVNAPTAS